MAFRNSELGCDHENELLYVKSALYPRTLHDTAFQALRMMYKELCHKFYINRCTRKHYYVIPSVRNVICHVISNIRKVKQIRDKRLRFLT